MRKIRKQKKKKYTFKKKLLYIFLIKITLTFFLVTNEIKINIVLIPTYKLRK